ncbi:MAG: transcriptional repressor LexA [Actinobacteria bacterium]|nr:transcriptional repressor LexA [Actinomycetota bacterium]
MENVPSGKRGEILEVISSYVRDRGYPPSVREIADAVGLRSPSTVHAHLATLERDNYLVRDPTKPRALRVCYPTPGDLQPESPKPYGENHLRPVVHVPLVGQVAAGLGVIAQENVEDVFPLPADWTGSGTLFMLRVRGDSMIDDGILDGDYVVARQQPDAEIGDVVVAGINDEEATVKRYKTRRGKIVLVPANERFEPMILSPDEVTIYGKVVAVLRRL